MNSNGISLAEALEILGPIRAWIGKDEDGKPVYWLDGRIVTQRTSRCEGHKLWVQQQK